MSETEILETIEAYGQAARRAVEAGIDVIAVHGAHGYLLHSFASSAVRLLIRFVKPIIRSDAYNSE